MAVAYPVIGHWYRRTNGNLFEVVAVDEQDATVELQFFDGTIDEVDLERWPTMLIEHVGAPEDWSGSVDRHQHVAPAVVQDQFAAAFNERPDVGIDRIRRNPDQA